jgi:hypothetical protein
MRSQYGDWESQGEVVDSAAWGVAGTHHIHETECLCGFKSNRSRSRTEHIIDETLKALKTAGALS